MRGSISTKHPVTQEKMDAWKKYLTETFNTNQYYDEYKDSNDNEWKENAFIKFMIQVRDLSVKTKENYCCGFKLDFIVDSIKRHSKARYATEIYDIVDLNTLDVIYDEIISLPQTKKRHNSPSAAIATYKNFLEFLITPLSDYTVIKNKKEPQDEDNNKHPITQPHMSRLSELYKVVEVLKREGLDTTDVEKKIAECEEEIINTEVIPILKEKIEPALEEIKREIVLVVDYRPGEPLDVQLSSKYNASENLNNL